MNIIDMTNTTSIHRFRPEDQAPPLVEQGTAPLAHCTCGSPIQILDFLVICFDSDTVMGRVSEGKT